MGMRVISAWKFRDLVRLICRHADTRLEVLAVRPSVSFETELARDVITLMTVFCARLYGKRSHKNKALSSDPLQ